MHTRTSTALLLTTLLTSTAAFIPIQPESEAPFPPDLDPALWAPLTTFIVPLASLPTSTASTPSSDSLDVSTSTLSSDPQDQIQELKQRQVTGQGAAVAATAATAADQISPVTTYQANILVDGTPVQSNVVYTQVFSVVPDPWPSPTSQGVIGLGTIQGTIGVVKTKRDLPPVPTQEAFLVGVEKESELVVSVPESDDDNQAEGTRSGGADVGAELIQDKKITVANAANGGRGATTTTVGILGAAVALGTLLFI